MSVLKLLNSPELFDFFQAIYLIEQQLSPHSENNFRKIGSDARPEQELIRFKTEQHLGFPGKPIHKAVKNEKKSNELIAVDLYISFMGLTGPSGVLPRHYSELMLQRIKLKDTAMRDFFDLFNHRLISLFYRSWKKYRIASHYQPSSHLLKDSFSKILLHLSGGKSNLECYYSGLFSKTIKSAQGLKQLLIDNIHCPVNIIELDGYWSRLQPLDQTRLAGTGFPEGIHAQLGIDACIGKRVWTSSAIKIQLYPNSAVPLNSLLPGTQLFKTTTQLIKQYCGHQQKFTIELHTFYGELPSAQISPKALPIGHGCCLLTAKARHKKPYVMSLNI